jgi:hypothetical protein
MSRWPVAGPSGCVLATGQQPDKQRNVVALEIFPNLSAVGFTDIFQYICCNNTTQYKNNAQFIRVCFYNCLQLSSHLSVHHVGSRSGPAFLFFA